MSRLEEKNSILKQRNVENAENSVPQIIFQSKRHNT